MEFLSFAEAREYARNLRLSSRREWREYCKTGKRPLNIPANPVQTYKEDWKGYGDWLGTTTIAVFNKKFKSFHDARMYVKNLGLRNRDAWRGYIKSGNKPIDIPSNPDSYYKGEWKGLGDWLGTGTIATFNRNYLPFSVARRFIHGLKLQNQSQWRNYIKSGKKPSNIPSKPNVIYKNEWKNLGDWLGTGTIATFDRKYKTFSAARKFVHSLGLKNRHEWNDYYKIHVPLDLPLRPDAVYETKWKGWGDWLGTGVIANQERKFRSYEDSKRYVRKLHLKNQMEWHNYYKSGKKPLDIPANPVRTYKNEWKGYGDWLGTTTIATQKRVFRKFIDAREYVQKLDINSVGEWETYSKSGKKPLDIPYSPDKVYKNEWKGYADWLGTGVANPIKWPVHKVKELLRDLIKSRVIYLSMG